ncbi:MAG: type IV pilin N-terminal domain-containing protein [Methanoregula sp.]|nr:type IV pilin N-terminal domain-containing protein [Methanoregula sp.]
MKRMTSDAVSPVVGVMLMLVVTIIIAAVVSAFSGGLGGSQQKTPLVSITAEPVITGFSDEDTTDGSTTDYATGFTAKNGIMFENTGGDTISLNEVDIILDGGGTKYTFTSADTIPSKTCLPSGIGGFFAKVGAASGDMSISPGDRFMFYSDNHYDSSGSGWGATGGKYLMWKPSGASNGIGIQFGTKTGYMIIDRVSSKVITSGYVVFR